MEGKKVLSLKALSERKTTTTAISYCAFGIVLFGTFALADVVEWQAISNR